MAPLLYTRVIQPVAIFSILISSSIPITVLLFPKMLKNKIFMEIILSISLCDMFGNWPYTIGYYPLNRTPFCGFEGFCNLVFFPASWMYSTMLTLCLGSLVLYNKIVLKRSRIHGISVGVPIFFALLIYTTDNYWGIESRGNGRQPCSFGGPFYSGLVWHDVTYNGLLMLNCAIMIAMLCRLVHLEWIKSPKVALPAYQLARKALIYYPVALVVCWFPHAIFQYIEDYYENPSVNMVLNCVKILHGAVTAVIFFLHSKESFVCWSSFLADHLPKIISDKIGLGLKRENSGIPISRAVTPEKLESEGIGIHYESEFEDFRSDQTLEETFARESSIIGEKLRRESLLAVNNALHAGHIELKARKPSILNTIQKSMSSSPTVSASEVYPKRTSVNPPTIDKPVVGSGDSQTPSSNGSTCSSIAATKEDEDVN